MKTFLITGGAGFIGSSLSEQLLNNNEKVIIIDNFCDFYNPKLKENNVNTKFISKEKNIVADNVDILGDIEKYENEEVIALRAFYSRSGIYKYGLTLDI